VSQKVNRIGDKFAFTRGELQIVLPESLKDGVISLHKLARIFRTDYYVVKTDVANLTIKTSRNSRSAVAALTSPEGMRGHSNSPKLVEKDVFGMPPSLILIWLNIAFMSSLANTSTPASCENTFSR